MSTICEVPFEPLAFDGTTLLGVPMFSLHLRFWVPPLRALWLRVSFRRMRLVSYQRNWRRSDSMPLLLTFCVAVYVVN
jgi:hypothetical protein